jgi:uncharacterized protein (TIGR02611 family)
MANKSPLDLHSPIDWLKWIGRNAKRMLIFILGVSVLLAGVAMLALPGPGVVVIIVGLVILATEFTWAERALDKTTERAAGAATKVTSNKSGQLALAASGIGMIGAGVLVAMFFSQFVLVGISIAIAGAIGLGTLHPKVQSWIDEKANTPSN